MVGTVVAAVVGTAAAAVEGMEVMGETDQDHPLSSNKT